MKSVTAILVILLLWYFARAIKNIMWMFNAFWGFLITLGLIVMLKQVFTFTDILGEGDTMSGFIGELVKDASQWTMNNVFPNGFPVWQALKNQTI